jgi:hypothetical protein
MLGITRQDVIVVGVVGIMEVAVELVQFHLAT